MSASDITHWLCQFTWCVDLSSGGVKQAISSSCMAPLYCWAWRTVSNPDCWIHCEFDIQAVLVASLYAFICKANQWTYSTSHPQWLQMCTRTTLTHGTGCGSNGYILCLVIGYHSDILEKAIKNLLMWQQRILYVCVAWVGICITSPQYNGLLRRAHPFDSESGVHLMGIRRQPINHSCNHAINTISMQIIMHTGIQGYRDTPARPTADYQQHPSLIHHITWHDTAHI